ncbi:uncharacterized protein [Euphorbia lathyris]|uniref:uncharacterized protein n=1 Tax=Euphorbia lathyris TaxID=212925 RepID=UPI0033134107
MANNNTNNTTILDQSSNPTSVYYIHPSENTNQSLVSLKLTGNKDYHSWARAFKRSLMAKNKMKFVDGSLKQDDVEEANRLAWNRCNQLVLSWLNQSVSTSISQSITWFENAYQVWQNLQNRFLQSDYLRIAELHDELASLSQGDLSVTDYFTKLQVIWEDLVNFRPILNCDCVPTGAATCTAIKNVRTQQGQDHVIKFLRGLNNNFSMIKTQVLMMEPLPSIEKTFNLVIQHERQVYEGIDLSLLGSLGVTNANAGNQSLNSVNFAQGNNSGFKKGAIKKCSYCGKDWHTVDQCYKKHGFPPNFKGKKKFVANTVAEEDDSEAGLQDIVSIPSEKLGTLMNMLHLFETGQMQAKSANSHATTTAHMLPQPSVNAFSAAPMVQRNKKTDGPTLHTDFGNANYTGHYDIEEDWYT